MGAVNPRIVVIGGGKMGEAIVGGLIAAESGVASGLGASDFLVANPGEERRRLLQERYGVACVADASQAQGADVVILAVKPQVMMGMLSGIAQLPVYAGGKEGPLFVSIAAGLTTETLEGALAPGSRVVRTMPNTPLLVAQGTTAVCGGANASEQDVAYVRDLFSCLGYAFLCDESDIDAVGAVSGSGPAYVAALIEALRDGGSAEGLDAGLAEQLALQTVLGTAQLMVETGSNAQDTRIAVCSPGGSTLAALAAMEEGGFSSSMVAGVSAAVARSKELAQC
ncbi:MAG: pyrroline-5-carboxylate reductase [Eggerthellaceae bacterium]|nr:pyrroline-5-carboxylate reductase [Eggerthellaceae bacterium]